MRKDKEHELALKKYRKDAKRTISEYIFIIVFGLICFDFFLIMYLLQTKSGNAELSKMYLLLLTLVSIPTMLVGIVLLIVNVHIREDAKRHLRIEEMKAKKKGSK